MSLTRVAGWLAVVVLGLGACSEPSPPEIVSFEAAPPVVKENESSTLSWQVSDASSLRLLPDGIDLSGRTTWTVTPAASTTYTLVAANTYGEVRANATVFVGDPPTIGRFETLHGPVNPGLPSTLAWEVDGATTVTLSGPTLGGGQVVAASGTLVVVPPGPGAVFTLVAENDVMTVEATTTATRAVPAFSLLIAGQSNAKGVNVGPLEALAFITAAPGVGMLGNDYVWKAAYEPTGDCVGHVDLVSADPSGGCSVFADNTAGVSPGVSFGNRLAAATGGEAILVPAAKDGSCLACGSPSNWQPLADRYDRGSLFGSATYRAQRAAVERGAPLGYTYQGASYGAVLWYQGTSETNSVSSTDAYFQRTDSVLRAFEEELGAPIVLVQLSSRGDVSAEERNLLYQRVREVQRRMEQGARTPAGGVATEARSGRYLVVTHDLPMSDIRHLSEVAQRELGRRVALAAREHLLGEAVDGSGPRLLAVEPDGARVVRVRFDRAVNEPASAGANAYSGYFAVFSEGEQLDVSEIRRDPSDTQAVRITLQADATGPIEVRYMPPAGSPTTIRSDVIRSASCSEPIPGTTSCLPAPAFGVATSLGTAALLETLMFEDGE